MKQRLYKRNGNKVGWWEAETIGDTLIKRWATREGGKVQERSKSFKDKGKQGRDDREQAEFMARSEINSQIDDGYVFEKSHTRWPVTNSLGFPMPMLATPLNKVTGGVDYGGSVELTPKLDGHRMLLGTEACPNKVADSRYKADGEPTLYSRGSQKVDLPLILNEAMAILDEAGFNGMVLDGEIYHHGTPLQDIKTLIARQDPRLQWSLYDVISDLSASSRRRWLEEVVPKTANYVKLLVSRPVADFAAVRKMHDQFVGLGYEGTILRWGAQGYVDDGRPKSLVKLKDFIDEEFKVAGMVFDSPRMHNGKTLLCPSFILQNNNKSRTTFKATVHGDMHQKHKIGLQGPNYWVGRIVTMSFQQRSKDGIPTICTVLRERDDL